MFRRSKKLKVIGIGDNVCDKYVNSGIMYPGGQALNFSVYSKQLGADSSYMGIFGRDAVANHVIKILDGLKIEHSRCRQYDGENGYAKVNLRNGDRVFVFSNKGGIAKEHPLELTDEDLEYISTFKLVHTSNNSYFDKQLKAVHSTGVPISYDFSGKWTDQVIVKNVAPYVSYAFLSCGSISTEKVQQICKEMKEAGCKVVIATRGSIGAMVFDGKHFYEQKPRLVEAIDTLGAGDSFATAFLLSMIENIEKDPKRFEEDEAFYQECIISAMKRGNQFSAKTCMVRGAFGYGVPFVE